MVPLIYLLKCTLIHHAFVRSLFSYFFSSSLPCLFTVYAFYTTASATHSMRCDNTLREYYWNNLAVILLVPSLQKVRELGVHSN